MDHSYSRRASQCTEKPVAFVEPAAKKRLVFPVDVRKTVRQNNNTPQNAASSSELPNSQLNEKEEVCEKNADLEKQASGSSTLRVLGQGCKPQAIQHGAVYKAVKVGNDIQLIRIDEREPNVVSF